MAAWQAVVRLGCFVVERVRPGWVASEGVVVGMATLGAAAGIEWHGRVEHRCVVLGVRVVAYMPEDTQEASGKAEEQGGLALGR